MTISIKITNNQHPVEGEAPNRARQVIIFKFDYDSGQQLVTLNPGESWEGYVWSGIYYSVYDGLDVAEVEEEEDGASPEST